MLPPPRRHPLSRLRRPPQDHRRPHRTPLHPTLPGRRRTADTGPAHRTGMTPPTARARLRRLSRTLRPAPETTHRCARSGLPTLPTPCAETQPLPRYPPHAPSTAPMRPATGVAHRRHANGALDQPAEWPLSVYISTSSPVSSKAEHRAGQMPRAIFSLIGAVPFSGLMSALALSAGGKGSRIWPRLARDHRGALIYTSPAPGLPISGARGRGSISLQMRSPWTANGVR